VLTLVMHVVFYAGLAVVCCAAAFVQLTSRQARRGPARQDHPDDLLRR
jgi:hypothetical protein